MARKTDEITEPEHLGEEGDACAQCGTPLATDQRYCLNCGTPRAEPRLDYERALGGSDSADRGAAAGAGGANAAVQWSPLLAVVAIAILGAMLLLGVLIGQDDNDVTVTQVPASTTSSSTTAPATTTGATTTTPPTTTAPPATTTTPGSGFGSTTTTPGAAGGIAPND